MAHQALQRLERNPRLEHVHGVVVLEGVRRHQHRERNAIAAVLVTNNTREFERVPSLPLEDWV